MHKLIMTATIAIFAFSAISASACDCKYNPKDPLSPANLRKHAEANFTQCMKAAATIKDAKKHAEQVEYCDFAHRLEKNGGGLTKS